MALKDKYINPFTDFGFKKLFGSEASKDLLIDFLNHLLAGKETIKTLTFKNNEQLGNGEHERKAIYDLYCENDQGEKFIIELQKSKQKFFKERALYYATFPIQAQAEKGGWDFGLKAVYLVAILDFVFDEDKDSQKYRHDVQLCEVNNKEVFYDKFSFIYLEMPKFTKKEEELEGHFDKWMYALKFLAHLEDRPKILKEKIFKKLFDIAEVSALTTTEYESYENDLKYYRDLKNVVDTAREEGVTTGIEKGILQVARNAKEDGVVTEVIMRLTGLSESEIEAL
jgi:predicted transposase/invertase (TIGR01784 family)